MSKRLRCRLGLHHWHYECKAEFPYLYVEATCYYCDKRETITDITVAEWFDLSWAAVWDKHNFDGIWDPDKLERVYNQKRP